MRNQLLSLTVIFSFVLSSAVAQTTTPTQNFSTHPRDYTSRKSFWTEINLIGNISRDKRWQYQIDYQYRRASDASWVSGGSTSNIFKDPFQQVVRPWIHYWVVPGQVRLSLSPVGYWITWTPSAEASLNANSDGKSTGQSVFPEFRICPQVTTNHRLGRVQFMQRYRYEFRFIGQRRAADNNFSDFTKGYDFYPTPVGDQSASKGWYGNTHQNRLRLQSRAIIPINGPQMKSGSVYIDTWNELFLSMGKNVKNNKLLNQNRFVFLVGYQFNKDVPIKVEAGVTLQTLYQYSIDGIPGTNLTMQNSNVENNTAYTIYLFFDDFGGVFKKGKKG